MWYTALHLCAVAPRDRAYANAASAHLRARTNKMYKYRSLGVCVRRHFIILIVQRLKSNKMFLARRTQATTTTAAMTSVRKFTYHGNNINSKIFGAKLLLAMGEMAGETCRLAGSDVVVRPCSRSPLAQGMRRRASSSGAKYLARL